MGKDLKGTELGREIHQRKDRRYEVRIYRNGVSKSFYVKTASEARTLHKKYSKKQKDVGLCGIDEIYSMLRIEWAGHIQEDSLKNYDYHYRIPQSIFDKHAIKRSDTSKSTICYQ